MDPWLPRLASLFRIVLLSLAGFGALVFLVQRWVVFPGAFTDPRRAAPTPPAGAEQVWLETELGRVEAWLFRAEGRGRHPALIFAHGNGELIDDWVREMADLADRGLHVLAVEFPGYGFSEGKPSRGSIRTAFQEAFDRMAARPEVDPDRIVAYGRSMGGGAAGDLARDRPVAALILQSTFSSTMHAARSMLVPGFLVRDRFDNVRVLEDFEGPVLLMHGPDDEVLPFAHAERLAAVRPDLGITRLDCGHNDCAGIWPDIRGHVVDFLRASRILGPADD